ncbi:radical SAM protein [Streptomyces sp. NPDC006967]|uniref:radical SAM protein n=1 Tax=Streptomyces sp. NPDC006967 TaxID=3156906 RepID=UPI0033EDC738
MSTADACAVGCRFCFRADTGRDVLDVNVYARALSRLRELGVEEVCLSGGEPTDHPEFRTLVRLTLQFGLRCSVVTAARSGRRLEALSRVTTMLSHVTVSADTREAERLGRTGRTISSTPPVFDALGHRRASLHVTVLDLVQQDLDELRTVLDKAEVPLEVSPLLPSKSFRFDNPRLGQDLEQIREHFGISQELQLLVDEYRAFAGDDPPQRLCASERLYLSADGNLRRCPYAHEGQVAVTASRREIREGIKKMLVMPPSTGIACAAICRSSREAGEDEW